MISQLKIPIKRNDDKRITTYFAYNLYGAWMEMLKPSEADFIHDTQSFNQYIEVNFNNQSKAELTVNLLSDDTAKCMLPILENTSEYYLKKYNCTVFAQKPKIFRTNEKDLVDKYFTSKEFERRVTLQIISPTTFKTNNHYAIFPTVELIIKSAVSKWNMLNLKTCVDDDDMISCLIENTMITNYRLNSTRYYLKDTKIQSFQGFITLSVKGAEPLIRLFDMLMGALQFTGLGIKATLGMGGIKIK